MPGPFQALTQPTAQRQDINTAALPGLTPGVTALLQGFLRNPQQTAQGLAPTSQLQQQLGQTFSQFLTGLSAPERTQGVLQDILTGGQSVLEEAQPIFSRNLEEAIRLQREFGGPRFSRGAALASRDLSQRALQDFNLFQQQVLESGRNRQLQALLGGLGGASQFALGQGAQQLPLIQQLLGGATGAGIGAPVITQGPSPLDVIGQLGGLAVPFFSGGIGGGGAGITPSVVPIAGTSRQPTTIRDLPPQPRLPFPIAPGSF